MDYETFLTKCAKAAEALARGAKVSLRQSTLREVGVQPLLDEVKTQLSMISFDESMDAPMTGGGSFTYKVRLETRGQDKAVLVAKKTWHQ
jgi:hypothetical protein